MKKSSLECYCLICSKTTLVFMLLIITVVTFSCTSALYVPKAYQETATASLSDLQSGKKLYIQKCASCHTLFLPEKYSKAEWQYWLNEMDMKIKMDTVQKNQILKYLSKGI